MDMLVGYTGFVGSNICKLHAFDLVLNSKNITDAFGTNPDLCVYSGVRAEKFLANKYPEKDFETILNAIENIKNINPKKLVLISTADVYKTPAGVNENTVIEASDLQPYGRNRRYLEEWVLENLDDYHIVRLPGLFGLNLKKNFLYDLIHFLPSMLSSNKFEELSRKQAIIEEFYKQDESGFFKCMCHNEADRQTLREAFQNLDFSALSFTDSRAVFQFYNLSYLWEHIQVALSNGIKLLNITVEPVAVNEIYAVLEDKPFLNELPQSVPLYDIKTIHDNTFNGQNGYIFGKQKVLRDVFDFVLSDPNFKKN